MPFLCLVLPDVAPLLTFSLPLTRLTGIGILIAALQYYSSFHRRDGDNFRFPIDWDVNQ